MWQSWVESEHYSTVFFDRITVFKVLYLGASVKGGARTCCVEALHFDATTQHI